MPHHCRNPGTKRKTSRWMCLSYWEVAKVAPSEASDTLNSSPHGMATPVQILKAAGLLLAELAQVNKLNLTQMLPVPGPAQPPLASLSLLSVPVCGVASYIEILLVFI